MMVQLNALLAHAPPQDDFERHLGALAQLIRKHIAMEEAQLFRRLASTDLDALGAQLSLRRSALLGEQGAD